MYDDRICKVIERFHLGINKKMTNQIKAIHSLKTIIVDSIPSNNNNI